MNWQAFLSGAVIAALISPTATFFGNWILRKIDFQHDYKKYILDKRKQAYSEAEKIINDLLIKINYDNYKLKEIDIATIYEFPEEFEVNPIEEDASYSLRKNRVISFRNKIIDLLNYSFWLSREFHLIIIELDQLTEQYLDNFYNLDEKSEKDRIGNIFYKVKEFEHLYKKLIHQYIIDIKNLKSLSFLNKID